MPRIFFYDQIKIVYIASQEIKIDNLRLYLIKIK